MTRALSSKGDPLATPEARREVWASIALQCADMREEEAAVMAIRFACMDNPPRDWPLASRGAAIRDGTALPRRGYCVVCQSYHDNPAVAVGDHCEGLGQWGSFGVW